MVSSLFSIKAAHCGDAIEFAIDGEGKRQREAPRYGKARGASDQEAEVSEKTSNGESPIAQDQQRAKSEELSVRSRAAQLGLELSPKS